MENVSVTTKLVTNLKNAHFDYQTQKKKGLNASAEAHYLKNIMFNNAEVIIQALGSYGELAEENERLAADLEAADEEYNELNHKYKALSEKGSGKKKTMTAVVQDGE